MTYAAIKTTYNGVNFRSRLEARWAVFFDLVGWKYEYEPYDLNGWIPDFILFGADEILVEVKPFSKFECFDTKKLFTATSGTEKETKEILLLGTSVFEPAAFPDGASIGWLSEYTPTGEPWFARAVINNWDHRYGFFHEDCSWKDRITGIYDGDSFLEIPSYVEVKSIWNKAGSSVQWKK